MVAAFYWVHLPPVALQRLSVLQAADLLQSASLAASHRLCFA